MDRLLNDLLGAECLVYLDDIILFPETLENHHLRLRNVLKRLGATGVEINLTKCEFMKSELVYLGEYDLQRGSET